LNKVKEDLAELNPSSSSPVTHSSLASSEWWRNASDKVLSKASRPGTPYSGRSIGVRDGQRITGPSQANDIASAYRMLMARLGRNSIKKELRLAEYYEKPSDKKRRLAMERHRRRFQELVG
jgi:ribosomal protein S21